MYGVQMHLCGSRGHECEYFEMKNQEDEELQEKGGGLISK